jgi:glycosyltransferase involved in cell wall biosynthesis
MALFLTNLLRRKRPVKAGETRRVLLFSQHLSIGGLERLVLSLGQALQSGNQWKVFLFSHDSDENAESYTDRTLIEDFLKAGIPVDAMKKGPGVSFRVLFRLLCNIYKNKIDVIHSHDMGTLVYAVLGKFISLGRVKVVHTQHSFQHINSFKRYAAYERIFTTFVDALTVVNESLIAHYVRVGVSPERIQVVNNGVSFADAPIRSRAEKLERRIPLIQQLSEKERKTIQPFAEDHWLLYLARVHHVKGQREASHLWRNMSPDIRRKTILTIVGPEAGTGELIQVLKMFEDVPDRDRVIFIDGTRTPHEWIAASDLFISCSSFEGMPLGPMEAIGSGLPAVLSAIDGHRFLNTVSRQYERESPVQGALLVDGSLSEPTFGTSAYYDALWKKSEWIRKQYSLSAMAQRYARLYNG